MPPRTIPPLRHYQEPVYAAIIKAALDHEGGLVVCRMPRQAGKNEVSARVELTLLKLHMGIRSPIQVGVKAAPTQDPQAIRSLKRLAGLLRAKPFTARHAAIGTDTVRLGRAEWWFGSGEPDANVVGATANLLLEFDESQNFDQEKHDKDYRPMAASTNAATAYWGTAWTESDLLETTRQHALDLQRRDGRRRVFDVPWGDVAAEVPAYGRFVEGERERLGHTPAKPHPVFLTQYELVVIAGAGRWLTPAQLEAMRGTHPRIDAPLSESHNVYVAGLDVGGADLSGSGDPDETVLTIGRARFPGRGQNSEPIVQVVNQYAWKGRPHDAVQGEVDRQLDRWRIAHVAVDATGIGEPIASHLLGRYGERRVSSVKYSRPLKSSLGWDLIAAINTGALTIWQPDGADIDHAQLWHQLRNARSEHLPGGFLAWFLDETDGHDDRLNSVALLLRAAQRGRPRIMRVRSQ